MRLDSGMSLQQEVGWTRDMLRMTRSELYTFLEFSDYSVELSSEKFAFIGL